MLKNGHAGLAGDGAGEQRLARAGRADHEHALGDASAEALELLRVLEERDDLLDLVLRLVGAGHVGEGDLVLRVGEHARLALAEAHRLPAAGLELAHEEEEHEHDEHHREERHEALDQSGEVSSFSKKIFGAGWSFESGLELGEQRLVGDWADGRLLGGARVALGVQRVDVLAVLDADLVRRGPRAPRSRTR
jgi:hypothetical protein